MEWAVLALGTVLVVESFLRLPLMASVKNLQVLLGKILGTLKSSTISDHWKEKVLPAYAGKLFIISIKLFALVLIAILPMLFIGFLGDRMGLSILHLLSSWVGILISTVIAFIYIFLRKRVIST